MSTLVGEGGPSWLRQNGKAMAIGAAIGSVIAGPICYIFAYRKATAIVEEKYRIANEEAAAAAAVSMHVANK